MSRILTEALWDVKRRGWLDSDFVRLKTGGVTIDPDEVREETIAGKARKILEAGTPVGQLSPRMYAPAKRAQCVVGVTQASAEETWFVVTALKTGVWGNDLSVEVVDASQDEVLYSDGKLTINLETPGDRNVQELCDWLNTHSDASEFNSRCWAEPYDLESTAAMVEQMEENLEGGRDADFLAFSDAEVTDKAGEVAVIDWARVNIHALPYFNKIPRPEGPNGERFIASFPAGSDSGYTGGTTYDKTPMATFVDNDDQLTTQLSEITFVEAPALSELGPDYYDIKD